MKQIYRLLIADDDSHLTQMLSMTLEESGFVVDQAANCLDAIDLLSSKNFDGLLLDYQLPDGNGMKILKAVQQLSGQLPVMILSGFYDIDQIAEQHGIKHVLHKPVSFEHLQQKLERMLSCQPIR